MTKKLQVCVKEKHKKEVTDFPIRKKLTQGLRDMGNLAGSNPIQNLVQYISFKINNFILKRPN